MDFPEFKYIFGNGNRANYLENPRLSPYPTTDTEYDRLFLWPRIGGTDTHWNFNATTHSIDGRTLSYHNYEFKYECE